MLARLSIDREPAAQLANYLRECITSDVKTIDNVKEYLLARHVQQVVYKLEMILLKYDMQPQYKIKSLSLIDLELLAINNYFSRYAHHSYLIPLEMQVQEIIRKNFAPLVDVLTNNVQSWQALIQS